jgi:EAL domain-containing protein (putative c-di-GMP-specific phosphodiesterase class I)
MSICARCDALPDPVPDVGTLFLAPPLSHSATTVRAVIGRAGLMAEEPAPGVLSVRLTEGGLARLIDDLAAALGQSELRDTRVLVLPEGVTPSLADLPRMHPLAMLVAKLRGRWLHAMIREDRLVSHFQPIVRADDPSEVFAHECLLRGVDEDGSLVPPGLLYDTARSADLMFPLDRAARLRAIRGAVEAGVSGRLFINFNPTSIYDPAFCLRTTIAAIARAGIDPADVVFEVVESDEVHPDLKRITRFYRDAGFRVALDDLGAGFAGLNLLSPLRPDFIKLDMGLIRDVDRDPYKAGVVAQLLVMARRLGIGTVAEGIETESELAFVREHGVDYVQGFLIARPACPPAAPRAIGARVAIGSMSA